ncbi:MAG TPA: farnesyl diphosphate synthase [Gemmatimonadales bacterium]|nr:farnesyl diphosphate synthase [Gemmatimonadales bacterium]
MREAGGAAELLARARILTDARLEACATSIARDTTGRLGQALAYALRTSGKRVRPALVLGAYRAAGGMSEDAVAGVAAAVEVVHTYSLVHDDLPCMDDDDQRRGRPTTHVAFDVPTATRAGWLLVPVAIELLTSTPLDPLRQAAMARTLLDAGGLRGMVGGQWLDLAAEGRDLTATQLAEIHRGKTGALIRACCELGGMAAGADSAQMAALTAFGQEVGLAFQVADDLLDATGSSEELGKTAGRDALLAKSTYVSLLGVEGARVEASRLVALAIARLQHSGLETEPLSELAGFIITRSS